MAKLLPGSAGNFGSFVYGRITKVNTPWGKCDEKSKGYSCDIQPLLANLEEDPNVEEIKDVPIDPSLFGASIAILGTPVVGMIARVAFMYRNPGYPFILSITAEGDSFPGQGPPLHPGQVPGESLAEMFVRHTHVSTGPGAPTTNTQATIPPGGPIIKQDLQR